MTVLERIEDLKDRFQCLTVKFDGEKERYELGYSNSMLYLTKRALGDSAYCHRLLDNLERELEVHERQLILEEFLK